jgi:hypothetical protein
MKMEDLMREAFCNTSDQSHLCSIAYDLVKGELSKEEAAIRILEFVDGMSERLPCLIAESMQGSQ